MSIFSRVSKVWQQKVSQCWYGSWFFVSRLIGITLQPGISCRYYYKVE